MVILLPHFFLSYTPSHRDPCGRVAQDRVAGRLLAAHEKTGVIWGGLRHIVRQSECRVAWGH